MKRIEAIIRKTKFEDVKEALLHSDIDWFEYHNVHGIGQSREERIYRGVLKDLAKIVHDNHLTLTTMLVVGEAIDNRAGFSELYNKHFTHLFRQGDAS